MILLSKWFSRNDQSRLLFRSIRKRPPRSAEFIYQHKIDNFRVGCVSLVRMLFLRIAISLMLVAMGRGKSSAAEVEANHRDKQKGRLSPTYVALALLSGRKWNCSFMKNGSWNERKFRERRYRTTMTTTGRETGKRAAAAAVKGAFCRVSIHDNAPTITTSPSLLFHTLALPLIVIDANTHGQSNQAPVIYLHANYRNCSQVS